VLAFIASYAKWAKARWVLCTKRKTIVLATLSALEARHKMGIVHRDLKPSNVMLTASGTKLLDFGIAKLVTLNASNDAGATLADGTMPGTFLATPRYASPEQFQGQPVDARSDLFSLGVILFEMLTGQPPFPGKSVGETRATWADRRGGLDASEERAVAHTASRH
jgi:eukaryotic-like serine/threonine-protein kinase